MSVKQFLVLGIGHGDVLSPLDLRLGRGDMGGNIVFVFVFFFVFFFFFVFVFAMFAIFVVANMALAIFAILVLSLPSGFRTLFPGRCPR